jgi:hypothetical protein
VASVTVTTRALPLARALVAVVLLLVAAASIAVSLPATTRALLQERRHDLRIPAALRAGWVAAMPFNPALMTWYAGHLERGDTIYIQAPASDGPSSARASLQLAAGFALLPHLLVSRPEEATVILSYDADPRTLPLAYAAVDRLAPGISAARVARDR